MQLCAVGDIAKPSTESLVNHDTCDGVLVDLFISLDVFE